MASAEAVQITAVASTGLINIRCGFKVRSLCERLVKAALGARVRLFIGLSVWRDRVLNRVGADRVDHGCIPMLSRRVEVLHGMFFPVTVRELS